MIFLYKPQLVMKQVMKIENTLPPLQNNSFSWYGSDMAKRKEEWTTELSKSDVSELEQAAEKFIKSGKKLSEAAKADFELPKFSVILRELKNELINGRGFALFKGLPVEKYSKEEAATIFYGIGTYIGNTRSQNANGHIIGHVRDQGLSSQDPNVRIYQTKERQMFHTDSSDVVGLLCLKTAKSGGLSMVVSSTTIFNEMHKLRPDLLEVLLRPVAIDRRGEVPPGLKPYYLIPVFNYHMGYLTAIYQRQYIESAQRFDDAPRLTAKHIEALDLFDELANSPKLHFTMMLEPGDLQFIYNHTLLHDRTGFEDWPDESKKRHLLRLWLSIPEDRPLPESFLTRYGSLEPGKRGGISVENTKLNVPELI